MNDTKQPTWAGKQCEFDGCCYDEMKSAHDELVAALFAVTNELACREAGSATEQPTSSAAMLIARAALAKVQA